MKDHEGDYKGFTHLSKAWYGKSSVGRDKDLVDEVYFGFYSPEGGTSGEMSVKWVWVSSNIYPKLVVFDDSWHTLAQFHDVIDLMGEHDDENITPDQFCELLLKCGFIDKTETEREG